MMYQRTFRLQAAHFNSSAAYRIAWKLANGLRNEVSGSDLLFVMADCHGHNFKIEVCITGQLEGEWLLDDRLLAERVMEWDNTNLSVHPDFLDMQQRATTENMAVLLLKKLRMEFGNKLIASVCVYETDDIFAMER